MKFLVSKTLHSNPNFTLLIGFYSTLLILYFIGDLFYLAHFFGSDILSILATLKGNEEEYIEPLSLLSILEHVHISLFLGIMALFSTLAIILRLTLSNTHKALIISIAMGSFLFANLSFLATYFLSDSFVYPFYYLSILWHLSGAYALTLILYQLLAKKA